MPRYIDADELYCRVKTHTNPYGKPTLDYKSGVKVLDMIKQAPTADVVPKSKYDLAVAEREANVKGFTEQITKLKRDTARGIFKRLYDRLDLFIRHRALNCTIASMLEIIEEVENEYHFRDPTKMIERCIVCGEIIPEGRQVCPNCEKKESNRNDERTIQSG